MTKAQEFFVKLKRIEDQVWDIMVNQAVEFAKGKQLDGSYDLVQLKQLIDELEELQRDILVTYKKVPKSFEAHCCAILKMADDIRSGSLLLY